MQPYWVTFEPSPTPTFFNLGVGITAQSAEDARELLRRSFSDTPKIARIEVLQDASELDQRHVVPNMGNWLQQGVWFPKL